MVYSFGCDFFPLIAGGFALKKQMLDDRRFPKLHLNLQRLLQVVICPSVSFSAKRRNKCEGNFTNHVKI